MLSVWNDRLYMQAFGMMGWRVGYLAFPQDSKVGLELLKAQDTIPICATQLSQQVALGALQAGRPWVKQKLTSVINNRFVCPGLDRLFEFARVTS